MLQLEFCLRGEAAETITGLGYSQAAYDATRARLARKYYRWLREHQRNESLETLKDWISQEAD